MTGGRVEMNPASPAPHRDPIGGYLAHLMSAGSGPTRLADLQTLLGLAARAAGHAEFVDRMRPHLPVLLEEFLPRVRTDEKAAADRALSSASSHPHWTQALVAYGAVAGMVGPNQFPDNVTGLEDVNDALRAFRDDLWRKDDAQLSALIGRHPECLRLIRADAGGHDLLVHLKVLLSGKPEYLAAVLALDRALDSAGSDPV